MLWISEGHDFDWLLRLSRSIIIKSKRACGGVSSPLNARPAFMVRRSSPNKRWDEKQWSR